MVGPFLDLLNLPTLLLKNFFFYLKKNNSFQKKFQRNVKSKNYFFHLFCLKKFLPKLSFIVFKSKVRKNFTLSFLFQPLVKFFVSRCFRGFVATKKFIFMTFSVLATNWHSWSYYWSYSTPSTTFYDFLNEWRDLNFPDISVEFHWSRLD